MRRRVAHIPLRPVIFVGCEGLSECSYAGLLQRVAREAGLTTHIQIEELHPGAGDPLARLQMLAGKLQRFQRNRVIPKARFALLDDDQAERDPARAARAIQLAAAHDIEIVWQHPTLEAVLLRHLPGHATAQPPDAPSALKALRKEWPGYDKPMSSAALRTRLDLDRLHQAAEVEPGLAPLLKAIGLMT